MKRQTHHFVEALRLFEALDAALLDIDSGTALEPDPARCFQLAVGRGDRVGVKPDATGEGPHAGQLLAGGELAAEDLHLDLRDQLFFDGNPCLTIQNDVHSVLPSIGPPDTIARSVPPGRELRHRENVGVRAGTAGRVIL